MHSHRHTQSHAVNTQHLVVHALLPSLISLMVAVDVKRHVYLLTLHALLPSLISLMVSADVKRHVYLLTLHALLPSLISLMVSVDVKRHVYLLTLHALLPSLISLMVSADVKRHVYLLTLHALLPSLISLMVSVDVKRHVYLLTLHAQSQWTGVGRGRGSAGAAWGLGGAHAGSSPQQGKGLFSYWQHSAQTLSRCWCSLCAHSHAPTSVPTPTMPALTQQHCLHARDCNTHWTRTSGRNMAAQKPEELKWSRVHFVSEEKEKALQKNMVSGGGGGVLPQKE